MITTDVRIVGSGPAGGAAALFLSTYGVDTVVLTRYGWTANTPRAHITNQRTIELMRDMGIEDQITDKGTAHHLMGQTAFCTSLAGEEIGRIRTWGTHPRRLADFRQACRRRAQRGERAAAFRARGLRPRLRHAAAAYGDRV